jgi:hypothetical protein
VVVLQDSLGKRLRSRRNGTKGWNRRSPKEGLFIHFFTLDVSLNEKVLHMPT